MFDPPSAETPAGPSAGAEGGEPREEAQEPRDEEREPRDLGFGSVVTRESAGRLLNRDGTFNVRRHGLPFLRSTTIYEILLSIPWWKFYLLVAAAYLGTNVLFALAYLACGPAALAGSAGGGLGERFLEAFFFSVQTITTVGYGEVHPAGMAANAIVTVEALLGLGGFAVGAGLVFARLARPAAEILFSDRALIAPYGDGQAFEFRIVNGRQSQLLEVEARVMFTHVAGEGSDRDRFFHELELARRKVSFFPLHWTIVHPIDDTSPLRGMTPERLAEVDAEFLVLIRAIDEAFSEVVHGRTSYRAEEIVWGARFTDIFERSGSGVQGVDVGRVHEFERLGPPGASTREGEASDRS